MRILLIEDDVEVSSFVLRQLRAFRHDVLVADSGSRGLGLSMTEDLDMVIIDLGLPDIDGLSVLKMIRKVSDVPVVIASGRGGESHAVQALELGADDYVLKPFSAAILHARLIAIARRCKSTERDEVTDLKIGKLVVRVEAHVATLDGCPLDLRPKEFRLLTYLAKNADRVISKNELRNEVWDGEFTGDATIAVHLSWLRRRLGETASQPRYLHTVRGVGVKLSSP
ncbi:response regulator transcription factor [Streptomyces sp. NPDC127084]|uniref:response regulator transcription factor n=1 Tax=Streptomyces sp. NPDC127084 TaxID=3347133 RepID=UPI003664D40C